MVEAWKEVPDVFDDGSPPPNSQTSSRDCAYEKKYKDYKDYSHASVDPTSNVCMLALYSWPLTLIGKLIPVPKTPLSKMLKKPVLSCRKSRNNA